MFFQKTFICEYSDCTTVVLINNQKTISLLRLKSKLALKIRLFKTHFLTTRGPKKHPENYFAQNRFLGGENTSIPQKRSSTVFFPIEADYESFFNHFR
jgi:hypothetical protein